ncbi:MAG: hypothetical protein ABIK44_01715 [candidate division WOR-3 bacterium]
MGFRNVALSVVGLLLFLPCRTRAEELNPANNHHRSLFTEWLLLPDMGLFDNPLHATLSEKCPFCIKSGFSRAGLIKAAIYSSQGQLVKQLAPDECLKEDGFSLVWDGKDQFGTTVGAGTYLCRITGDEIGHVVTFTKSR